LELEIGLEVGIEGASNVFKQCGVEIVYHGERTGEGGRARDGQNGNKTRRQQASVQ